MIDALIAIACGLIVGVPLGMSIERLSSWEDASLRLIRESDRAGRWVWKGKT